MCNVQASVRLVLSYRTSIIFCHVSRTYQNGGAAEPNTVKTMRLVSYEYACIWLANEGVLIYDHYIMLHLFR